jgi:hypothetical protein
MAASQTLQSPPSNAASSEYGSDEDERPRPKNLSDQLPADTLAVLGVLSEEVLANIRAVVLPKELKGLTEPELLSAIVDYFSSGEIMAQVARTSDKSLWETAQALDKNGSRTIATLHDFATQYFDPEGAASKSMLIQSIGELLRDLYRVYSELHELLTDAKRRESEPPKLDPPVVSVSSRCEVLGESEGDQAWEPGKARPLELNSLPDPYPVARIVDRSDDIDPHAHLLVDAHYAISGDGLLRPVSVPHLPSSSRYRLGDSSMRLQFDSEMSGGEVPEISRFSITKGISSAEVTYTQDSEKEEDYDHSPWNSHKAAMCVPEIFTRLVEKFDELDCSDEEKAQLVAQVFCSQNLIYSRDGQLSALLAACDPRHRLSLTLGLGMGDCTLLSAVLQQLLSHAEVNAVVEGGAICSPDGESYERPGHARVKVYGSTSILRLDPTLWCVRNIFVHPIENERLEVLQNELLNADAETCYRVGQRARKLLTTPSRARSDGGGTDAGNPGQTDDASEKLGSNGKPARQEENEPRRGHQLSDDFERQTQVTLYRLLASNEQDLLVAEVWAAYQEVQESGTETSDLNLRVLLNEQVAAALEKEVALVGLEQSKICTVLPQMLQTLARRPDVNDSDCLLLPMVDFIGTIDSIEVRTTLLARTLDLKTCLACAMALERNFVLTFSSDSARFLERLVRMLADVDGGFHLHREGEFFHQQIILLTTHFSKQDRDSIIKAYVESYDTSVEILARLLCREHSVTLYSPLTFPREVLASIFPALEDSAVEVAEKVFAAQDDCFFIGGKRDIDQNIAALLILGQYFPAHARPELKPLVTDYVAYYLRDYENKSVDFRCSPAVAELCDLVHINDSKGLQLALWRPYYLYSLSCDCLTGRLNPGNNPKHHFNRGYLLKELSTLGLLDPDEIADCLYTPSTQEIKAAFDALYIKGLLKPGYDNLSHDGPKKRKAAELDLAMLAESNRKGVAVPHANLLDDAVDSGLINQATLELAKVVLNRRKLEMWMSRLHHGIPDTIAYLFSIRDSLQLRSYVRIKTACALLDTGDLVADSTKSATEPITQGLLGEGGVLRAHDSAYPSMARLYIDTDSSLLTLGSEHYRFVSGVDKVRDGLSSITKLHKIVQAARHTLARQNLPGDDRKRSQQIVLSLLNEFPPDSQDSLALTRANRVPSHVWQDEVAKSLRLQRTEGGARILRKISQSRNENFDSNRVYVHGDDLRAINWRASARSDGLVVRSYQNSSRSIADSYQILIDLADVINLPEFGFFERGSDELKMSELALDTEMLTSIANFMNSLTGEGKKVRLSVFAFGAVLVDEVVSSGRGSLKDDLSARSHALEALSSSALSYAALCTAAQCVPDAYSLAGLMNPHERAHFLSQIDPGGLILHLHGKATAQSPIDPALKELVAAGRAARVHL